MRVPMLLSATALAACGFGSERPAESAEQKISQDLRAMFDGIDVAPAARCVRSNATPAELAILRQNDIATQPLTRQIFERPETLTCLQANGVIEVVDIVEVVQ